MSTPAASAAAQLRLCQLQERRLQRQLDSSESVLAQQQERLQMCGEQVAEVEKSGAADMIDQLDQLSAQEETLDSDIRRTQDTIMDLRRRLHDARMGTIAATTASQHHEAASTGSSLTPSSEGEKLRADPVKVDTQALEQADTQQTPAEEPEPEAAAVAAFDAAIDLLTKQTVHGAANFVLNESTLPLPDAV